jgi:hypothetical protein
MRSVSYQETECWNPCNPVAIRHQQPAWLICLLLAWLASCTGQTALAQEGFEIATSWPKGFDLGALGGLEAPTNSLPNTRWTPEQARGRFE